MIAELLMNLGTGLLAIAAIPQFISMWKNRQDLKGYSVLGSAVVFVSLVLITTSFFLMGMWVSVLAQALPLILWLLITIYSARRKKE